MSGLSDALSVETWDVEPPTMMQNWGSSSARPKRRLLLKIVFRHGQLARACSLSRTVAAHDTHAVGLSDYNPNSGAASLKE